ncbi:MAG TPA: amidase [Planctomycetota bacterium]|nr:amidase [Planctomycetota bacterium]
MRRARPVASSPLAALPLVALLLAAGCGSTPSASPRSGSAAAGAPRAPAADLEEVTLADLQQRLASGQETARSLTEKYLARIASLDRAGPALASVIELNPDALSIADALDRERGEKGPRGPLHGIPVLIKDNIATADRMTTTAGSLALEGSLSPQDAFVAHQLRAAGAVVLGKTNLSEWANIRSVHSSSGWSARGGQVRNPYALDRNPSGSSSGSAVAVASNLCALAVGTETDGSIVSPASANGIVGIKPTLGLVSRTGIVPIAHSQDTAGPMARTVADAAVLLGVLAGADPDDAATADAATKGRRDYGASLDAGGLRGARIGVVRDKLMGHDPQVDRLVEAALDDLRRLGAEVVDPADIPKLGSYDDGELEVLLYELKADLARYFEWIGPHSPMHSLADVIAFDTAHAEREMPFFGQDLFELAQAKGPLTDAAYLEALESNRRLAGPEGIDAVMDSLHLDALVAPTTGPAWLTDHVNGDSSSGGSSTPAAVAGYPHVTVPAGQVAGLPVGLSFFGRAWSEPTLIRLAYAYEQGTQHRRPPTFRATAER